MTAGAFTQTTVAAPERPVLRESVNAVPGAGLPVIQAAKDGNATLICGEESATARNLRQGGEPSNPASGGDADKPFSDHGEAGL